jgi:uncharacterized membrane protein YhaH (DUF805 family)
MNWFLEVLKKYAVFEGRARRKEYWYFVLFSTLISVLIGLVGRSNGYNSFQLIYSLAVFLPSIAVAVRRMHDVNKSGWFCLIPIYNLILCCTPGTEGPNKYGSDPKRPEFEEFLNESEPGQVQ